VFVPADASPPPAAQPPIMLAPPGPAPMPVVTLDGGPSDHELVVGHWGIEARRIATSYRTAGNDPVCVLDASGGCPIYLNALSLRRWQTPTYGFSAGLVLATGGGSRSENMVIKSWDTYFGIGPIVSASFLLSNWKHLAVSLSPQLDAVFFTPRGSGSKTFFLNARGLFEGELHLGFIGVPGLSLGLASGLEMSFRAVSNAAMAPGGVASQWDIGFSGPQSLWGLVTNMYLRFYL
jgi:hypothetical protein